jgi:cellulose synthase/poly-beta-1,6-N-acetylglucosamine synthase-like glycosyltransferase
MKLPKVSIIIPAYNEEENIDVVLKSATQLNYPSEKLEIILIDDGSTDKTLEKAKNYPIKIIKGPHKGVGVSRNLGWKKSKGEIIFFLDADQRLKKNFLKKMVKCFSDPKVAAADCQEEVENKNKLIAKFHYLRTVLGIKKYSFPFAKLCRRSILKELNGINPQYGYYDDWEFTWRIVKKGYKIAREWDAIVYHHQPENFSEMWRQNKWAGKSIVKLFKDYKIQALRKLLFPFLCAPVPIYVLFLFGPLFLKIIGILGITLFMLVELKRSFEMYKITKWNNNFLKA